MSMVSVKRIEDMIYLIRGQKVMLDSDLAELYGVDVKRLNEQVKRNLKRFPLDFMFQMAVEERDVLRSQFATFEKTVSARKYLPFVFTENGVAMLSGV
ncbi:MAG TPA: ORF6N domain-containing protein [Bacteriovoracaceae bacterium]|nr:ORF6N domain-containing protein [Bacteriovoracaceae bacterium]